MVSQEDVITVLKQVIDPELNIDIWTLGLIYNLDIREDHVDIRMTYTTPLCPYGPTIKEEILRKITEQCKIGCEIEVTFDPPYTMPDDLRSFFGV